MTQQDLTEINVGQNLDDLANLDPRGYGVCRILYEASRAHAGAPLSITAAKKMLSSVGKNEVVVIMTGFVLLPHNKAEMDGMVSAMLLARALVTAFEAKPLIVCPEDCLSAVRNLAPVVGLHLYESVKELREYPVAMGVIPFTKDASRAEAEAERIVAEANPALVVTVEAPGANELGVYHNAAGKDVTHLEAKTDILFKKLQARGVADISIGDLGNEMGMGTIAEHLYRYIPGAKPGSCACGCGGGIVAATRATTVITATVSDWGCYAMIAALAFLCENPDIMGDDALVGNVITEASRSGMIDMWGWLIPAVDGCDLAMNVQVASLMRKTVISSLALKKKCASWFDRVLPLGFYQERTGAQSGTGAEERR